MSSEDVENLSRGRPTKSKIGSRSVPHRLTKTERGQFERAKNRGYMTIKPNQRQNLGNIWFDWCDVNNIPCIILNQDIKLNSDKIILNLNTVAEVEFNRLVNEKYAPLVLSIHEDLSSKAEFEFDPAKKLYIFKKLGRDYAKGLAARLCSNI